MKRIIQLVPIVAGLLAGEALSQAQTTPQKDQLASKSSQEVVLPPGVTEEMLTPPPVPRFMLERPTKPLAQDEMLQQVRAAQDKAQVKSKTVQNELKAQVQKPVN